MECIEEMQLNEKTPNQKRSDRASSRMYGARRNTVYGGEDPLGIIFRQQKVSPNEIDKTTGKLKSFSQFQRKHDLKFKGHHYPYTIDKNGKINRLEKKSFKKSGIGKK